MAVKRGPKTVRRDGVVEAIRNRIVDGEWQPGERLPERTYFIEQYGSANLVQTAFNVLYKEGLIERSRARKLGTRVHPSPPFLNRYAVLLNNTPTDMNFHAHAVHEAAQTLIREGRNIEIHFDLNREFDDPEHLELHERIMRHEFAGIYRETLPQHKQIGALGAQAVVPVVDISGLNAALPNFAFFARNRHGRLREKALAFLRNQGAETVALIAAAGEYETKQESRLRKLAEEAGLRVPQQFFHVVSIHSYSLVIPILRALFSPENSRVPDSILFCDDNLLPHAMKVLDEFASNPHVKKLHIAAVGNYPYTPEFSHPVHYVCFDHLKMLKRGLRFIDGFRKGETVSGRLTPSYWEGT